MLIQWHRGICFSVYRSRIPPNRITSLELLRIIKSKRMKRAGLQMTRSF